MAEQGISVAKAVSEFGIMAVISAFFVVLASVLMVYMAKWLKSIVNDMISRNTEATDRLIDETKSQKEMLEDIVEGLRPETQTRVKNIVSIYFDYAVEKTMRIIKKVREENHISDVEQTNGKIRMLLLNLHDDRNSKLDVFTYRGRKLSAYTSAEWIEWVSAVVEREVYDKNVNNGRSYTNVRAVYDRIKLDFYHRMNSI